MLRLRQNITHNRIFRDVISFIDIVFWWENGRSAVTLTTTFQNWFVLCETCTSFTLRSLPSPLLISPLSSPLLLSSPPSLPSRVYDGIKTLRRFSRLLNQIYFFFPLSNQADADIEVIKQLRSAGEATATKHKEATSADPTQHSVLLTQYDPGTYMADLDRYIR